MRPQYRSLIVAAMISIVLVAVMSTTYGRQVELAAFDLLTVLTAQGAKDVPIIIVGIDESSFGELGMQWPWPRDMHALLVDSLARQGAAVIAFDVVFAEASDRDSDKRFAAAIKRAGNVVLAGDLAVQETARFSQMMQIEPLPLFRKAGARTGIASVDLDSDLKVRLVPTLPDAFWREVVQTYHKRKPGSGEVPVFPNNARIRYLGPNHSFEYVSFYQALDPEAYLPPDIFRDNIVIVGFDVKTSPDPGAAQTDMFATPFQVISRSRTPGAEVQATLVANGLTNRMVREVPQSLVFLIFFGMVLLAAYLMHDWRPLRSLGWGSFIIVALAGLSWLLFSRRDTWLPVLSSFAAVVMTYVAQGGSAFIREQQRRKQIKQAFACYVSPQVVEEMTTHPERLNIGGTRRVVTIMFTDLANFTSLSEQMGAEDVAKVLNVHLTAMTRIIMRHQGTVGKFIGDAVMAFWSAPLEDPEHALHACEAAVEMQAEMERYRNELQASGLPLIHMRIGIHTGEAVVGNLGSKDRFDYTTIGDSVNLASRLEGVNKLYGTGVLLSAATAGALGGRLQLRRIDRVRVKGKKQAIDIYTPCDDQKIVDISSRAIGAYLERQWDHAAALWHKVQEQCPDDKTAEVFLCRIEKFRTQPPPVEWDGGTSLDKL